MEDFLPMRPSAAPAAVASASEPSAFAAFAPLGAPEATAEPSFSSATAPIVETEPCAVTGTRPKLELQETDGRITRIIVTCGCGERTAIDCVY